MVKISKKRAFESSVVQFIKLANWPAMPAFARPSGSTGVKVV